MTKQRSVLAAIGTVFVLVNEQNQAVSHYTYGLLRTMNTTRLLILPCLTTLLTGCRCIGTQRFTAFAPSQGQELAASSRTVLDVRCNYYKVRADYNLRENLSMLAPMPKRWKIDLTVQVERVVKGQFGDHTLLFHWLRDPTQAQCETLGIPHQGSFATNGMPLRIGFDARSDKQFRNLKLMIRNE